jgi:hypothetical protein
MSAGTGAAPGQAPPDLPSLLLDGRICYIGMPVRTCRFAAQQLYLFHASLPLLFSCRATLMAAGNVTSDAGKPSHSPIPDSL